MISLKQYIAFCSSLECVGESLPTENCYYFENVLKNAPCRFIINETKLEAFIMFSLKNDCTGILIVPSSTSPILAVPATVLKPSAAKNIRSPANSCIVCPFTHPMFLVTGATAKLLDDVPDSLNILS